MNVLDYIRVVRQRWWLVIAFAVVGAAAAALFSLRAIPVYQSSASVLVSTPSSSLTDLQAGAQFAESRATTYAALASTASVLSRAADSLGGSTTETELSDHVSASTQTGTSLIVVTATAGEAKEAANRANAVAGALNEEVQSLEVTASGNTSPILLQVVQAGRSDGAPIGAGPTRNAVLGAIAGLVLGIGFVMLAATLDSRLRTPRDLARVVGHSPVAIVPRRRAIFGPSGALDRREAFRTLRAALGIGLGEQIGHSIAVAPVSGGGNSAEVVLEFGRALADVGLRVLVIDADLRTDRARMERVPGDDTAVGLAEILEGRATLAGAVQSTPVAGLATIGPGVPSSRSGQSLNRQAMRATVGALLDDFDVVVIACPPLLARSDSAISASVADTSLVVVEAGRTTRGDLERALDLLRGVGVARPLAMLNNVSRSDMVVTGVPSLRIGYENRV